MSGGTTNTSESNSKLDTSNRTSRQRSSTEIVTADETSLERESHEDSTEEVLMNPPRLFSRGNREKFVSKSP
jgi:hypothetical protein